MQTHKLKTIGHYFDAVARGEKTFEVRRNDRAFQTGDVLVLKKLTNDGKFYVFTQGPGSDVVSIRKRITYLLQGGQFGIESGYCVLGLGDIPEAAP